MDAGTSLTQPRMSPPPTGARRIAPAARSRDRARPNPPRPSRCSSTCAVCVRLAASSSTCQSAPQTANPKPQICLARGAWGRILLSSHSSPTLHSLGPDPARSRARPTSPRADRPRADAPPQKEAERAPLTTRHSQPRRREQVLWGAGRVYIPEGATRQFPLNTRRSASAPDSWALPALPAARVLRVARAWRASRVHWWRRSACTTACTWPRTDATVSAGVALALRIMEGKCGSSSGARACEASMQAFRAMVPPRTQTPACVKKYPLTPPR